jgi:hypothetical protein
MNIKINVLLACVLYESFCVEAKTVNHTLVRYNKIYVKIFTKFSGPLLKVRAPFIKVSDPFIQVTLQVSIPLFKVSHPFLQVRNLLCDKAATNITRLVTTKHVNVRVVYQPTCLR